jgi:hypothetical protein
VLILQFIDRWANSENVKIHYLESADYDNTLTPLVYVPGALNFTNDRIVGEFKIKKMYNDEFKGQ